MSILAKYIAKSPDTAARVLGAETIIMSTLDSTLFSLNTTGSAIWEAADGQSLLSSIVDEKLCREFEVEADVARKDVETFVETLVEHGILLVSEQPFSSPSRI